MKKIQTKESNDNTGKASVNIVRRHSESDKIALDRKESKSKKVEKIYKVTVTYVEVSEEEQKNKLSILTDILRKV